MKQSGLIALGAFALIVGLAAPAAADNGECSAGTKLSDNCQDVTYAGCCKGNSMVWCEQDGSALCYGDCSTLSADYQECGWASMDAQGNPIDGYTCGGTGSDPSGKLAKECTFTCTPNCNNRTCGPDGCAGSCGKCGTGQFCTEAGKCETCTCDGLTCGADPCGNPCGTCADGKTCDASGKCADAPAGCAVSTEPGCGGCDCEAAVCDPGMLPDCCTSIADGGTAWDDLCVFACGYIGGQVCPCVPYCTDMVCGDDGCGGTCGTCKGEGEVCNPDDGTCCVPKCTATGSVCGDDGCGGTCGTCTDTQWCGLLGDVAACIACGCEGRQCGDDGCGKPCGTCAAGQGCGLDGRCVEVPAGCVAHPGQMGCPGCGCEKCVCDEDAGCCNKEWDATCAYECAADCATTCACVPDCKDKTCGSDGCGGTCGSCGDGQVCDTGVCKGYPAQCLGASVPSSDKCVVPTQMDGCCDTGNRMVWCAGGKTFCIDCPSILGASYHTCGWTASSGYYACGGSGEGPDPNLPMACGATCIPHCEGKECGDDGCGRTCGACKAGTTVCKAGKCEACTPDCKGKDCGDDGCGGTCGTPCAEGLVCGDFRCVTPCFPDCRGKKCGDDGCGALCGSCDKGWECKAGACAEICTKQCQGKDCGPDGCGGVCAVCADGQTCSADGKCVAVCKPDCTGKSCGSDGCSGTCGTCTAGLTCTAGQCTGRTADIQTIGDVPQTGKPDAGEAVGGTAGGYDKPTYPGSGAQGTATTGGCTAMADPASFPFALLLTLAGALLPRRRR